MTCADIQDLILKENNAATVAAHMRSCTDCQAFQEAALELDLALSKTSRAPEKLNRRVMAALVPKPTYLPEVLDFVGWAAMLAVMIGVVRGLLAT